MPDYVKLHRSLGVKVGLCEIQGRRPSQEDCLQVGVRSIKDFPRLNTPEQNAVLTRTFAQLQKQFGQSKYTGSTCCAITAWVDGNTNSLQVSTANIGDSTAYLIIIDEALESVVQAKRINDLHNPDPDINYEEYERVATIAAPTRHENHGPLRLNGELAVTRGFGDKFYEQFGLLHIPEIFTVQKTLSSTQKAYVVLACDGLTEKRVVINNRGQHVQKAALSIDGIANIVNTMRRKRPLDQIAEHLADSAYVNGSHDNISVAVFAVGATPTSAVICDGHNGIISQAVGENFFPLLEKNIQQKLLLNNQPKIINEIKIRTSQYLTVVSTTIVTETLKSAALRKIFVKKLGLDDESSNKAQAVLVVENHNNELAGFIAKYKKSAIWKKLGSKQLSALITLYDYARMIIKTLQHPDCEQALNKTRMLFKDSTVRYQLEKTHGYWGWLLQKLGLTKDQRLVKFSNAKKLTNKR